MKDYEKAFIDYCKGYKLKEIADRRNVELATVKSWMTRGINGTKWTVLKAECEDEEGNVDMSKATSFVSGKGNLFPSNLDMLKAPQCYPSKLEEDRALVSLTLQSVLSTSNYNKPCESDEEVIIRLDNYFNMCITYGIIPTVEGLANTLYIATNTLWEWEQGKRGTVRQSAVKNAKLRIQDFDAKLSMQGKINPATYIFRAKNYYGMRDVVEQNITHNNPLGNSKTREEIEAELDATPDESDIIDVDI